MKVFVGRDDPIIYTLEREQYSVWEKEIEMPHDTYIRFSKLIGHWNEMQTTLQELYAEQQRNS